MEKKYTIEYRPSHDKDLMLKLSDKNHIITISTTDPSNFGEILENLYKETELIEKELVLDTTTVDVTSHIVDWEKEGENDIVIFRYKETLKWQPISEMKIMKGFMKGFGKIKRMGYINGRNSFLHQFASIGMSSASMRHGYDFWIEGKKS